MATPNIPKALRQYQQVNTEASAAIQKGKT